MNDETGRRIDDVVQPFQIEASGLRGRLVRLGPLLDEIHRRHAYPEPVAQLLSETIVLAALLASGLKYDGVFTLQTKGDGPIRLLVADVTSGGAVRGHAIVDRDRLASADGRSVPDLLGQGHLAFTVDQGDDTERYQGIVALEGESLAECVRHYFRQSEQVDSGLKLAAAPTPDGWRAGGVMIQRVPDPERQLPPSDREDDWRRAMILMDSATASELTDPALPPNPLLYRLYNEDGVRVFAPAPLAFGCRCSRARVTSMLAALPETEIRSLTVDRRIEVVCEFCNTPYAFDEADLSALYAA